MGSSMSAIYDDIREKEWDDKKEWLEKKSEEIKNVYPNSSEYTDLKWLFDNKEKILGNRRLIDLLR